MTSAKCSLLPFLSWDVRREPPGKEKKKKKEGTREKPAASISFFGSSLSFARSSFCFFFAIHATQRKKEEKKGEFQEFSIACFGGSGPCFRRGSARPSSHHSRIEAMRHEKGKKEGKSRGFEGLT